MKYFKTFYNDIENSKPLTDEQKEKLQNALRKAGKAAEKSRYYRIKAIQSAKEVWVCR